MQCQPLTHSQVHLLTEDNSRVLWDPLCLPKCTNLVYLQRAEAQSGLDDRVLGIQFTLGTAQVSSPPSFPPTAYSQHPPVPFSHQQGTQIPIVVT